MTAMICSRCAGEHHSMQCPGLRDTLIALGVQPEDPPPARTPLVAEERCRPFYAQYGSKSLVSLVMDATW